MTSLASVARDSQVVPTGDQKDRAWTAQKRIVRLLGGTNRHESGRLAAVDGLIVVRGVLHFVEVKAITAGGGNDKLSIKADQLWNAMRECLHHGGQDGPERMHTIAVDCRGSRAQWYYKRGLGAFRLGQMLKVRGARAVLRLMALPVDDLPVKARPSGRSLFTRALTDSVVRRSLKAAARREVARTAATSARWRDNNPGQGRGGVARHERLESEKGGQHAPRGGITLKGTFYHGGEFIPSTALKGLSQRKKDELNAKKSRDVATEKEADAAANEEHAEGGNPKAPKPMTLARFRAQLRKLPNVNYTQAGAIEAIVQARAESAGLSPDEYLNRRVRAVESATEPAQFIREFAAARIMPVGAMATMLGSAHAPEYLTAVESWMDKQKKVLVEGRVTLRSLVKAMVLMAASQGTGERAVETILDKLGHDTPFAQWLEGTDAGRAFQAMARVRSSDGEVLTTKKGQEMMRPEEAAAGWLLTPAGKKALDNMDAGQYDPSDWSELGQIRKTFGDDRMDTLNVFGTKGTDDKGKLSIRAAHKVLVDINAAKGDPDKIANSVKRLAGIGDGKVGFIMHLMGLPSLPTIDAIEVNLWLTGQGDISHLDSKAARLAREFKRNASNKDMSAAVTGRLTGAIDQLRKRIDKTGSITPHIMHHWLWDVGKGHMTSHAGMYHAMDLAQRDEGIDLSTRQSHDPRQDEGLPGSPVTKGLISWAEDGKATIRVFQSGDISTVAHELGHLFREDLGMDAERHADLARAAKWCGVKNGVWHQEAEEKFARGFERYLMDGQAPSKPLRRVFGRFKTWLGRIYGALTRQTPKNKPVLLDLSPEIRGVYDRLLTPKGAKLDRHGRILSRAGARAGALPKRRLPTPGVPVEPEPELELKPTPPAPVRPAPIPAQAPPAPAPVRAFTAMSPKHERAINHLAAGGAVELRDPKVGQRFAALLDQAHYDHTQSMAKLKGGTDEHMAAAARQAKLQAARDHLGSIMGQKLAPAAPAATPAAPQPPTTTDSRTQPPPQQAPAAPAIEPFAIGSLGGKGQGFVAFDHEGQIHSVHPTEAKAQAAADAIKASRAAAAPRPQAAPTPPPQPQPAPAAKPTPQAAPAGPAQARPAAPKQPGMASRGVQSLARSIKAKAPDVFDAWKGAWQGTQHVAEKIGRATGMSRDESKYLRRVLTAADTSLAAAGVGMATVGMPGLMPITTTLPAASVAYAASVGWRHPVRTVRAAHKTIKALMRIDARNKARAKPDMARHARPGFAGLRLDRDSVGLLARAVKKHASDPMFGLYLAAALDRTKGDVPRSIRLAKAAMKEKVRHSREFDESEHPRDLFGRFAAKEIRTLADGIAHMKSLADIKVSDFEELWKKEQDSDKAYDATPQLDELVDRLASLSGPDLGKVAESIGVPKGKTKKETIDRLKDRVTRRYHLWARNQFTRDL